MRISDWSSDVCSSDLPLMWRLVPTLVGMMGGAYPELTRANALVTETLRLEEARFKDMLARGLRLLEEETARLGASQALPGAVAFKQIGRASCRERVGP